METFFVGVAAADDDVFVEVLTLDEAAFELAAPLPEQVPKAELHPVPQ